MSNVQLHHLHRERVTDAARACWPRRKLAPPGDFDPCEPYPAACLEICCTTGRCPFKGGCQFRASQFERPQLARAA